MLRRGDSLGYSRPAAALRFYEQADARAKSSGYRAGYFRTMNSMTASLNRLGRHPEARRLAEEALGYARQDTSQLNLGFCYMALGGTALRQGELGTAVQAYEQAATYMRRLRNEYNLAVIHNSLGLIYREQSQQPRSLRELQTALTYFERAGQRRKTAELLFNVGTAYGILDSGRLARHYFRRTARYLDPVKDQDIRLALLTNLGQMTRLEALKIPDPARRRTQQDSALAYHREALQLSRTNRSPVSELSQLIHLAMVYNDQQQFGLARPLTQQALALARRHGNAPTDLRDIYRELIRLGRGTGDFRAAYYWREQSAKIDSTLENQEVKGQLQAYEMRLKQAEACEKLDAQQKQIGRLEAEQRRQREQARLAGVSGVGATGLLLLGLLYYRQRQRAHANALLALQREQDLLAVRAELQGQQKERTRIAREMHDDMGASLTVIGLLSEVMKTRPETAAAPEVGRISELSADLMATMNQLIWALNPSNDSLNGLIAYIRAYARELLESTDLQLRVEAEEAAHDVPIGGDDRRNVFLAVKEALHNVVKHASARRVTLRLRARDGALALEVCDDGRGFDAARSALRPGSRNGLTNMAHRLREAGGTCQVRVAPGGGTCVALHYPYPTVPAQAGTEVGAAAVG